MNIQMAVLKITYNLKKKRKYLQSFFMPGFNTWLKEFFFLQTLVFYLLWNTFFFKYYILNSKYKYRLFVIQQVKSTMCIDWMWKIKKYFEVHRVYLKEGNKSTFVWFSVFDIMDAIKTYYVSFKIIQIMACVFSLTNLFP